MGVHRLRSVAPEQSKPRTCRRLREDLLDRVEALETEAKDVSGAFKKARERPGRWKRIGRACRRSLEDLKGRHARCEGN